MREERAKLRKLESEEAKFRRSEYIRFLESDQNNIYRTFSHAKSDQNSIGAIRRSDDTLTRNLEEKADILATYYHSVYKPRTIKTCDWLDVKAEGLNDIDFSVNRINEAILSLDSKNSCGPDGVSSRMLLQCRKVIAPILSDMFKENFDNHYTPISWRSAKVIPIPKKNDTTRPENTRPISMSSVIAKVMEKVIVIQFMEYLEKLGYFTQKNLDSKRKKEQLKL